MGISNKVKRAFSGDKKIQKKLEKKAEETEKFAQTMAKMSNEQLRDKTDEFKNRIKNGESLDKMAPEAFAVVREAAKRTRGEYPYKVQVMGAFSMLNGDVTEMVTGEGKCQPDYTYLPTPDGWKQADEIRPGDYLFDLHGHPTKVTGVYPQGKKEIYEVELRDGRIVECGEEHRWSVYTGYRTKNLQVKTTLDMFMSQETARGYKYMLPVPDAVQYPKKNLPIPPYILGLFLGDGCKTQNKDLAISSADIGIVEYICRTFNVYPIRHKGTYSWTFSKGLDSKGNHIRMKIADLDLHYEELLGEMKCHEKYIPEIYRTASEAQRWELIQGMMDTDGSICSSDGKRYNMLYSTTSVHLRDDFLEVLYSLGISASWRISRKKGVKNAKHDQYSVIINVPNEIKYKFFKLGRKKEVAVRAAHYIKKKDYSRISIKEIRRTGKYVPQRCFTVNNPEHLYLTTDYVATHNTITATMPAYLEALTGKGVHIVTVNEYLSRRDAESMGLVYKFLGLTVGWNSAFKSSDEKRAAYACDITYTTNSELGFDYLRDNMVFNSEQKVQRGLHFAIIDEADSILIDEARTPLIIASSGMEDVSEYGFVDKAIKRLEPEDYYIFTKEKQVSLTPDGIHKLEKEFNVDVLYSPENQKLLNKINKSLYANIILKKDVDYLVRNDEIALIDQFTGRVMEGHSYSEGLQQAIQAKEGVTVQPENKTSATITYQNFFRMYDKLAGMTGTAKTEEEEFLSIYNMYVTQIPTNKPVIREDKLDAIYRTKEVKFDHVVEEVKKAYEIKRPVLIGTVDVDTNEYVSALLTAEGIPHETLNAKNHEREAEIIAKAGLPGSVTLATNMAGRGTDIKLNNKSRELGGLYVIGTERHESRRIDNQLRGRSGRQGDPGTSIFFVSLEDDLMKRYGGPAVQRMFDKFVGDDKLESKALSKSITNAQKTIEGINFDIRKQLIEYDDVLRKQREIYFERREQIVNADSEEKTMNEIHRYFNQSVEDTVLMYEGDDKGLYDRIHNICQIADLDDRTYRTPGEIFSLDELHHMKTPEKKTNLIQTRLNDYFEQLINLDKPSYSYGLAMASQEMLQIMDECWIDHIDYMDKMRNAMGLRSYAQRRPIDEYKDEGFRAFSSLISHISFEIMRDLCSFRPMEAAHFDDLKEKIEDSDMEIIVPEASARKKFSSEPLDMGQGEQKQ